MSKYIVMDWKKIPTIELFQVEKSPGFYVESPDTGKLFRIVIPKRGESDEIQKIITFLEGLKG